MVAVIAKAGQLVLEPALLDLTRAASKAKHVRTPTHSSSYAVPFKGPSQAP